MFVKRLGMEFCLGVLGLSRELYEPFANSRIIPRKTTETVCNGLEFPDEATLSLEGRKQPSVGTFGERCRHRTPYRISYALPSVG